MKLQALAVTTLVAIMVLTGKTMGQQPLGASYYDLTLPRRFELGFYHLLRPRSLTGLGLGYKAIITERNEDELCGKFSNNEGVVGIDRGRVVWVPEQEGLITCVPGNIYIGSDPTDGDPVITWDLEGR